MEYDFVKITNAVYGLLDFFPDGDPLKNKAKEKALAILEHLTVLSEGGDFASPQKEKAILHLADDMGVLESYLKIAKHQGWIDNVNFLIVTKEYDKIKNEIGVSLISDRKSLPVAQKATDQKKPSRESVKKELSAQENQPKLLEQFTQRQKKILEMLSKGESGQVADFLKELPDVTKRTIRRDLDDLLKSGRITRSGEWNKIAYKIKESS